jgi:hypothetical protein
VFIVQAYQTCQHVVPRGGIFLGKRHSDFAESSDGKMNVQSACALNTRYLSFILYFSYCIWQWRGFFFSPLAYIIWEG